MHFLCDFDFYARFMYNQTIVALAKPICINHTYLFFAKLARKTAFLEKVNAALACMKEDGTYSQLIHTWLEEEPSEADLDRVK